MSKIIDIAVKEIGTIESPKDSNKTKYGQWFGLDGVAWCAIFVSWVYHHAGTKIRNMGWSKGFAGCQDGFQKFKKLGWVTKNPIEGDIVFFDWNGDGRYDHVGIFNKWIDKDTFSTIEGNTSLTNQSNGGQVMARVRKNKNVAFVHVLVN